MVSRQLGTDSFETFATPITGRNQLPLRIAVYDKIAKAVRSGELSPSQLLPTEAELGSAFQVSRTVMREALILLQEDGLIRTKRGIGRFIVDVLPKVGIEQLHPIEQILSLPIGRVEVKRLQTELELVTDFTRRGLGLQEGAVARIWESVVHHDGAPVAFVQEWVSGEKPTSPLAIHVRDILESKTQEDTSMLNALIGGLQDRLGPGTCEVTVSNAGARRAQLLDLNGASPVLLLSQTVAYRGAPLFVAKYILRQEVGHFTIVQS